FAWPCHPPSGPGIDLATHTPRAGLPNRSRASPRRSHAVGLSQPECFATPWIAPDDGPADPPGASGASPSAGDAPRLTLSRDGTVRTLRTQGNTSWSRLERPSLRAGTPACASGRDAS